MELENTELLKLIVVSWRYYLLVIVGWVRAELLQSYKTKTEDPKYLAVCSWVRVSRSITGSLGCVPTSNLQYSPRQKTMFWGWALDKRQKKKSKKMRPTRHLWGDAGAKYFHTAGVIIPDNNLVNLQFCNLLSFPQLCKSKWWFHESLQRIDKFISRVGKESPQGVGEGREAKLLSLSLTVACTYLSLTVSQSVKVKLYRWTSHIGSCTHDRGWWAGTWSEIKYFLKHEVPTCGWTGMLEETGSWAARWCRWTA